MSYCSRVHLGKNKYLFKSKVTALCYNIYGCLIVCSGHNTQTHRVSKVSSILLASNILYMVTTDRVINTLR
jgi:hypothetical protein